jgi:hypothetical protein
VKVTCIRSSAPKRIVSANVEALLFDIVNVQNWPAAPRFARSGSPCCKVAFDCGSAAAGHLSIFAGLAQTAERRPRNAEAACSIHAAGTKRYFSDLLADVLPATAKLRALVVRPHSSAGQSTRLVSGRSQVRFHGAGPIHSILILAFVAQSVEQPFGRRQAACSIHAEGTIVQSRANSPTR